jgi:transcriptional regulator GlxA family with amidase domain
MRWVRAERLARCRRELADPSLRHRSIAQVAQSWGFGDMTHFSRLFRDIFGVSPRGYRQASLEGIPVAQFLSDVHTSD